MLADTHCSASELGSADVSSLARLLEPRGHPAALMTCELLRRLVLQDLEMSASQLAAQGQKRQKVQQRETLRLHEQVLSLCQPVRGILCCLEAPGDNISSSGHAAWLKRL